MFVNFILKPIWSVYQALIPERNEEQVPPSFSCHFAFFNFSYYSWLSFLSLTQCSCFLSVDSKDRDGVKDWSSTARSPWHQHTWSSASSFCLRFSNSILLHFYFSLYLIVMIIHVTRLWPTSWASGFHFPMQFSIWWLRNFRTPSMPKRHL